MQNGFGRTITEWQQYYQQATLTPSQALPALLASYPADDPAWITRVSSEQLNVQLAALQSKLTAVNGDLRHLPLYGVPFAVKDNIDVAGWPTTAACPAFAYQADNNAAAVARLLDAGAILMGKTNLDQFATGLVGTRSPYGEVPNSFDPAYISGGSSSGSASLVARGLVAFTLGTDTAGSGRVPAGLNNIVGLKPTRGKISTRGLVPACRTLDCISVFALTVDDAEKVLELTSGFDAEDSYSRLPDNHTPRRLPAQPVFAIPDQINWYGDQLAEQAFNTTKAALLAQGVTFKPVDFSVLYQLAALLYEGPWIAERQAALGDFYQNKATAIHPVVRQILEQADRFTAVDCFNAQYRYQYLYRKAQHIIRDVDAICVPTIPVMYSRAQINAEPMTRNSHLGTFTNFVNLADWCALALPGPFRGDGLPAGFTLIAPAWHDQALADWGKRWQQQQRWQRGALSAKVPVPETTENSCPADWICLAVVGAHLTGMPLNYQLTERHGYFVEATHTAAEYRLFALADSDPPKPGLMKSTPAEGHAIAVELWHLPLSLFGSFINTIPAPLGIGTLTLADGRRVKGFICEPLAMASATDISAYGGWRNYQQSQTTDASEDSRHV